MSQGPGAAGPVGGAGGEQPDEEQIREYLAQLRQAAADELVAQAFSVLASGAEVKLGRNDARLLIDAATALSEAVGDDVREDLKQQMTNAVSQLRMAQVDAEKQLAQLRAEGKLPPEEEETGPSDAGAEGAGEEQEPAAGGQAQRSRDATSRLWIPGR